MSDEELNNGNPVLTSNDEEAVSEDGRAWYVIHCYSGYENKVRHSIEQRIETMGMQDQIFDVIVPTEEEIEIKDGKRR
jgi:transcriptional antiterminator NusG